MTTAKMRYGFIAALPAEARAVAGSRWKRQDGWSVRRQRLAGGAEQIWVQCGIGPQRAAAAARWLVAQQVAGLAVFGVSGGLGPELLPGDLVLASAVFDGCRSEQAIRLDLDDQGCDLALLIAGLGVRHGPILTVGAPVLHPDQKTALFQRYQALAVDMESAAVARVAAEANLPCTVLRSICDPARRPIPAAAFDILASSGDLRWRRLLSALCKRPKLMFDLVNMQRDFGPALKALKLVTPVLIRQLMSQESNPERVTGKA